MKFMGKKHILIVDDEQDICFLLAALLRQLGYETDVAHSLGEGAEKLTNDRDYDVVFLDLNLPDGLGHKIIPTVHRANHRAKVVMISAHDGMLRKIKHETPAVDQCLSKPFDRKQVSTVLHQLGV